MNHSLDFISPQAFVMLMTVASLGLALGWGAYDMRNLIVSRRRLDMRKPLDRDLRFGYVVGVVISAIGVIGVIKYHWFR